MPLLASQSEIVTTLRRQLEGVHRPLGPSFSSGSGDLDRILPGHAFHKGTLVEYLADPGSGSTAMALITAREACREGGALVVIDRRRTFYPPAAVNLGIGSNIVFVRPRTQKDQLWTLNQSLRCSGVGAVLCWPDQLDDRAYRSLQLAAEHGGTTGLFVRPISARGHPTWSEVQLLIETLPANGIRRLRVNLVRCRSGNAGASVELDLDDETGTLQASRAVSVAAPVAIAAVTVSSARA